MTISELHGHLVALENEYFEQSRMSSAKGNPYITGLGARIAGIRDTMSIPVYAAAPEMLEILEKVLPLLEARSSGKPGLEAMYVRDIKRVIAKATGGEE